MSLQRANILFLDLTLTGCFVMLFDEVF